MDSFVLIQQLSSFLSKRLQYATLINNDNNESIIIALRHNNSTVYQTQK